MAASNLYRSTTLCSMLIVSGLIVLQSWDLEESSTHAVPIMNDREAGQDYRMSSSDRQIDETTNAEASAGIAVPPANTSSDPSTFEAPKPERRFFKYLLPSASYITHSTVRSSEEEPEPVGIISPPIDVGAPLFSEGSPLFGDQLEGRQIDPHSQKIPEPTRQ